MTDPIPRVPDPGPDDDPRVRAAVAAFAEQKLAGVSFEPISPTAAASDRKRPRAAIALIGAAAAALAVPLIGHQLSPAPVPAVPATSPAVPSSGAGSLAQCLAGLASDDVVAGSPKLSVGGLRIVGYVVTRYESDEITAQNSATEPVPVVATDDRTGETVQVRGGASMVLWQSVEPDNPSGDFLTESGLQRWVNPRAAVPEDPGSMVFASVFQQSRVTVTLQVRCGGTVRDLTVTGTNNPVLPDRTTSVVTGIECAGPEADVRDYGDELAAFARMCHSLV